MDPNSGFAKFLRVVAIIFMSLTTLFNLMGGIGSSCIAFFAETYGPDYALSLIHISEPTRPY